MGFNLQDHSTTAAHYEYDPFVALVMATGTETANNHVFRFPPKHCDSEPALYYYWTMPTASAIPV